MRLGICLPEREEVSRSGSGALPEPIRSALLDRLGGEQFHFNDCHVRNGQVWHGDRCLSTELDRYLWYAHTSREPDPYDLRILKTLAASIPVTRDPWACESALDKYTAHLKLQRAGIRVADFVLTDRANLAALEPLIKSWGTAVLKPRRGAFGLGVGFIDSYATLRDVIDYIRTLTGRDPDGGYLLERYYPNDPAEWTSVTLIGGEIMYGYRKRPHTFTPEGTKVYDPTRRGGEVDPCPVTPAQAEQARKAQQALGLEIVGFDMVTHHGQPIIVDENTAPGFYPELFPCDPVEALYRALHHFVGHRP